MEIKLGFSLAQMARMSGWARRCRPAWPRCRRRPADWRATSTAATTPPSPASRPGWTASPRRPAWTTWRPRARTRRAPPTRIPRHHQEGLMQSTRQIRAPMFRPWVRLFPPIFPTHPTQPMRVPRRVLHTTKVPPLPPPTTRPRAPRATTTRARPCPRWTRTATAPVPPPRPRRRPRASPRPSSSSTRHLTPTWWPPRATQLASNQTTNRMTHDWKNSSNIYLVRDFILVSTLKFYPSFLSRCEIIFIAKFLSGHLKLYILKYTSKNKNRVFQFSMRGETLWSFGGWPWGLWFWPGQWIKIIVNQIDTTPICYQLNYRVHRRVKCWLGPSLVGTIAARSGSTDKRCVKFLYHVNLAK